MDMDIKYTEMNVKTEKLKITERGGKVRIEQEHVEITRTSGDIMDIAAAEVRKIEAAAAAQAEAIAEREAAAAAADLIEAEAAAAADETPEAEDEYAEGGEDYAAAADPGSDKEPSADIEEEPPADVDKEPPADIDEEPAVDAEEAPAVSGADEEPPADIDEEPAIEAEEAPAEFGTDEGPAAGVEDLAPGVEEAVEKSAGESAEAADYAAAGAKSGNEMVRVIGVRFRTAGKIYYFDPGEWEVRHGSHVIVETVRGIEYGTVVGLPMNIKASKVTQPLKEVIRVATLEDNETERRNRAKEKEAFRICQEKIRDHGLDMKLINAEYTFDNSKALFYFTADGRVDFRDLVKDLASVFRTRIELRQIGVRDETKILGGYGICGRPLCCHTWMSDFIPVSIKMAKEQNLSLNPGKISGVCGRLMCCLKNEADTYEELNRNLPRIGDEVQGSDGLSGQVESVNVLRQTVRILVEVDDEKEFHEYNVSDLTILRRRRRGGNRGRKDNMDPKEAQELEKLESQERQGSRDRGENQGRAGRGDNYGRGDDQKRDNRDDGQGRDNRSRSNRNRGRRRPDQRSEQRPDQKPEQRTDQRPEQRPGQRPPQTGAQ